MSKPVGCLFGRRKREVPRLSVLQVKILTMRQAEGDAGRSRATRNDSKSPKSPRSASTANGNQQHETTTSSGRKGFGFCCFRFKEKAQINALTVKIANREKKFGMSLGLEFQKLTVFSCERVRFSHLSIRSLSIHQGWTT